MDETYRATVLESARCTARGVLAPRAREVDSGEATLADSIAALQKVGLLHLPLALRTGETDDLSLLVEVLEEVGAACTATGVALVMHWTTLLYLTKWSVVTGQTPLVVSSLLEQLVEGTGFVASCFAEPKSGADIGAPSLTAARTASGWVIDGTKLATGARLASHLALHARVVGADGKPAVQQFVLQADTPGVEIVAGPALVGVRGASPDRLTFYQCAVDDSSQFGDGETFAAAGERYPYSALLAAAPYVGTADAALRAASAHLATRRAGGAGPALLDRPDVQLQLAELAVDLEQARSLLRRAAQGASASPDPAQNMLVGAVKVAVARMASSVSAGALQLCGARALANEAPSQLERLHRDALALSAHPPSTLESLGLVGSMIARRVEQQSSKDQSW